MRTRINITYRHIYQTRGNDRNFQALALKNPKNVTISYLSCVVELPERGKRIAVALRSTYEDLGALSMHPNALNSPLLACLARYCSIEIADR